MRAIILAAGYGNRMRPLTDTTHKTLLKIGDETVLSRIILNLLEVGVTRITLVTGYRADDLRAHLDQRFPGHAFDYVHNPDFRTTNNLASLHLALEAAPIDSDLLLIESDLVFHVNLLRRLLASPHENVALVDHHAPGMDGTVVTLDGTVITGVIPPHLQGRGFTFADKFKTLNIYKFSRDFSAGTFRESLAFYVRTLGHKSYYELILGVIIYLHAAEIHAEVIAGERWCEIDDPNDLDIARYAFDPACRTGILQRAQGGYWNYGVLDFCFLRNAFFPTPAVLSELQNAFKSVLGHYGSAQTVLDTKMAYYELCQPRRIVALNGLSQVYPWLARRFQGRRALVPAPTFGEYARAFPGADTYADGETGFDLDELETKTKSAEVVCLVNPNNPTGSLLRSDWIFDLATRHPEKTFIVDESFLDFSTEPSLLVRLAGEPRPNIVVLKSLSKSLGVPGLRLGWVQGGDDDFLRALRDSLPIWNLNAIAENFLEIILKHRDAIKASFVLTVAERDSLHKRLAQLPFVESIRDSAANFLLVRFRCSAECLEKKLQLLLGERNIHLKSCSAKFGGTAALARTAIGTPEDNQRLIEGLKHVFHDE
jgi:histidinol-phosphate/aromatic aminotransferase/cobyric acid decarboxylase-like protein/choline kinase